MNGLLVVERKEENIPMEARKGNLLILIAALLFSIGGLCIKMIPWNGMAINGGRSLIACLILFAYLRIKKQPLKITRGTLLGAVCAFGATVLYSCANTLTSAANAILLQYVAPVFIILMMWLFFRERPKRMDVITCALVFGGIACFFLDGLGTGHLFGNLLALGSGISFAGVCMINKIPGGDSFSSTFLGFLTGGLVGIPFLLREQNFSATPVLFIILLGVFQMGIAYVCFCAGIKKTAPVTAALIAGVEPVLNPILVAIFVGEMVSPISAMGGALVLGSVTVYNVILAKKQPITEAEKPEMLISK